MYPVILQIGPFSVYSYGLMLVLAFFAGTWLASRYAASCGTDPDVVWNFCLVSVLSGIVGARLFYVLENLGFYLKDPLEIIKLYHGGLSWFGGLFMGTASGIYFLKKKRLSIYKTLDMIVPFVALAQSIGRIGCFLNGCCYGRESSWGMYFPSHDKTLIPTQLYSSLALLCIFMALRFIQRRPHKDGLILYAYLFLYSIKRFLVEFWRFDNKPILWDLSLFQFISAAVLIFSLAKIISLKKTKS